MKVAKFPGNIKKKYLRLASVYRRSASRDTTFDWSVSALIECHAHESTGAPLSKSNGYGYGKWMKDINLASWIEDIQKGDFCKFEFTRGIDRWWSEPALRNVIVPTWFPYERAEAA